MIQCYIIKILNEFYFIRTTIYRYMQYKQLGVSETTAYSWWNCQMSSASANCCQLIPQDRATVFSSFFRYGKNYIMSSLAMSVRPSVCPSVRPSTVEITLERGFDRSAEPIDLKIDLNMGN